MNYQIPAITLFLFAFLFSGVSCAQQPSEAQTPHMDSLLIAALYAEKKKEFTAYESDHGHFILTSNVRMHYLTWGRPGPRVLVWSHGTYSSAYELTDLADSLVKLGLFVVAIDYYGHGFTPFPRREVSLHHVADDIAFLLKSLKIKEAIIGGWSRGGAVSTAFYDTYPQMTRAIVLEDGGSVAWSVNDHKKDVDSLTREIRRNYTNNRPPRRWNSEYDAFYTVCRNLERNRDLKKIHMEFLRFFSRCKPDSSGQFIIDQGISDFVGARTAEQLLTLKFRAFAAPSLFAMSTEQLNPRIIYRNLAVPVLIYDPVSANDWFDFTEENGKLRDSHPNHITHLIYRDTGHDVKVARPVQFLSDLNTFLKKINW
jgi:pimeloyl-ACP methyl ester carboxylesterase